MFQSKTVICQKWEESEAGWGTRPDGYTLHLTREHRDRYVKDFYEKQRKLLGEATPPEYTRVDGDPYECPVTDKIYARVLKAGDGVSGWTLDDEDLLPSNVGGRSAPWPGGPNGWVSKHSPRFDV
jgi:hypothetical protein